MMRRKNTSRRVHALSSDSIRSDEIAATDMALSRDWSRDGVSDMRIIVHDREWAFIASTHGPSARQNQSSPEMARKLLKLCGRSELREVMMPRPRGRRPYKVLRSETVQYGPPPFGDTFTFLRYSHMA